MSKLKAGEGMILLKPIQKPETIGNIVVPDMEQNLPDTGEILDISPMYNFNRGEYAPTTLKVGMKVLIPKMATTVLSFEGEKYWVVSINNVSAIIEE